VELPHDWSSEDMPDRAQDFDTPAITVRNGTWKFRAGDGEIGWSAAGLNDSSWMDVSVPFDWRAAPTNFAGKANVTGWFRRNFTLSSKALSAYNTNSRDGLASPIRLALGQVACADETYVNGIKVGATSNNYPHTDGCIEFRAYVVDASILAADNVVAVRVNSRGGNQYPGGLCDVGALARNEIAVATGGDWEPSSPFDPARSENGRALGYSVNGVGLYRKTFNYSTGSGGTTELVSFRFDGVMRNADFYVNGVFVANQPYGYTTVQYDVTNHLQAGENVLAVLVRNTGKASRWYSGSGIYRHVFKVTTPVIHIDQWGVVVNSVVANDHSSATLQVSLACSNNGPFNATNVEVSVTITDADRSVAHATTSIDTLSSGGSTTVTLRGLQVVQPRLWDLDDPHMYLATVTLTDRQSTSVDTLPVKFGIRYLNFSVDHGFQLNGKPVQLRGGCVHHDNGPLGSRTIARAEERRVEKLKQLGYSAIRTSHNPVSPAFLDACDRLGVLVMEEAFDCWEDGKNDDDYHKHFDAWWKHDLTAMIRRDINHPSIIMWSIGNEIYDRQSTKGVALAKELANTVRSIDNQSGRAVTSAVPLVNDKDEPFFASLDVGGYNYANERMIADHSNYPERVMVSTESVPWGSFQTWDTVWNHSWITGDFLWTAIDYIGESGIGSSATTPDIQASSNGQPWNWHISFCGDLDITLNQKPQSYYRSVLWGVSELEMAVHRPMAKKQQEHVSGWGWPDERQSWTWPGHEGTVLAVRVFARCTSGSVALALNNNPVPGSPMRVNYHSQYTATFNLAYSPGVLSASCVGNNSIVRNFTTAKAAARIALMADRNRISANRNDLSYVTVAITDADGTLVPDAQSLLTFVVSGDGELAATGTGDPTDVTSFHATSRTTWQGRAIVILRPTTTENGTIKLTATATGLPPATTTVFTYQLKTDDNNRALQVCSPHSWPANASHIQCAMDMGENGSAAASGSADGCAMSCCTNPRCAVWQWAPAGSSGGSGCWLGHEQLHGCRNNSDWVGGSRVPPEAGPPPPPPPPLPPLPPPPPPLVLGFLSATFGDHMVLQRAPAQAVVFGHTEPGAIVTTRFDQHSLHTVADANGTWRQRLPATLASPNKSYSLLFESSSSKAEKAALNDILFGAYNQFDL
jgi:beta-galactosidase